jgi:hypothetical protein
MLRKPKAALATSAAFSSRARDSECGTSRLNVTARGVFQGKV